MNKKATFRQKLLNFLDGKGFYLVVLLCVSAVGVSGWYLTQSMRDHNDPLIDEVIATAIVTDPPSGNNELVSGTAQIVIPSPQVDDEVTAMTPTPVPVTEPATPAEPISDPGEADSTPIPLVYTWPVKGNVITEYSLETLLYDETMGDWRVHTGLDISAPQGTNVLATAAGTVIEVFDDDFMGTTVVIDHGQDILSTYSNLQALPTVEAGDSVYTGSIIGAIGSTAISESATDSHLHFELSCNGTYVDPLDYLPQQ